jgi:hypothetical protein
MNMYGGMEVRIHSESWHYNGVVSFIDWMSPGACLDCVQKKKISYLCLELNS